MGLSVKERSVDVLSYVLVIVGGVLWVATSLAYIYAVEEYVENDLGRIACFGLYIPLWLGIFPRLYGVLGDKLIIWLEDEDTPQR